MQLTLSNEREVFILRETKLNVTFLFYRLEERSYNICFGDNHFARFTLEVATSILTIDHFNNCCLGSHNGAKTALLGSC